ncbi:MAG: diguanylate cyclase [Desulfobulbaceae bacterium]|nr:diguanylate cyclase [Desulfobulbaceae bacterium]
MDALQILSIILVIFGAGFMLASIVVSLNALASVPLRFRQRWKILAGLMVFFFGGYITFIIIQLEKLKLHMEFLSGIVFLGGAIFVFRFIHLARKIISQLQRSQHKLREARDDLEIKVEQRTVDLKKALSNLVTEAAEREKISKDLAKSNTELMQILNSSADGIHVVGLDFIIRRVNQTYAQMAGLSEDELVGLRCDQAFVQQQACGTEKCSIKRILEGETRIDREVYLETHDGRSIPCQVTTFPYYDPDGGLIGIVEEFRDISNQKKMEDRLREISITDELTGLLNRRGFLSIAAKQLELADRLEKQMYLLYADIDNMKWINDNLGHSIGDEALKEASDVLVSTFRKADVIGIGRLGGDEYAVLMFSDLQAEGCDHPVLKRIEDEIAQRNKKPNRKYALSISVGIVPYVPEECSSLEEFISRGDEAMYTRKREKKVQEKRMWGK